MLPLMENKLIRFPAGLAEKAKTRIAEAGFFTFSSFVRHAVIKTLESLEVPNPKNRV